MLKRITKIAILCCTAALSTTMPMYAQSIEGRVVDLKIYFPYDEAYLDSTYMENPYNLQLAALLLNDSAYISTVHQIKVTAQSSPEGTVAYNASLSERRKNTLEEYFTTHYPQIDSTLWSFGFVAENWAAFRRRLASDPNLPNRDEVLAIADKDRAPDAKEWLLKTMHGGTTWLYIKEHILPTQRYGASMLFIPLARTPILFTDNTEATLSLPQIPHSPTPISEENPTVLFGVKTNLVLDALSVVNLGVEIPLGRRWSVVAEVVHPWWRSWRTNYTMQIESYHGELKYWLGNRTAQETLQGWNVGIYGGWGRYDIQPFSETGVQGTFTDYGVELGYAHAIARNLNLEYTVGLGYVATTYADYKMAYKTDEFGDIKVIPFPWRENRLKAALPTRCGISLVWTIKM